MARVLVVDASREDRAWLSEQFSRAGYETVAVGAGEESIRQLRRFPFNIVVTDWSLPDMTGLELVGRIRNLPETAGTRILMVSARNTGSDVAKALETGVDDFVAKPPRPEELLARAGAVLRRPVVRAPNGTRRVGALRLDRVGHKVTANGAELRLAPVEFRLIAFFMEHPGRVLSRQELLEHVWNRRAGIGERTVDVHIRRLRALLEPHGCADALQTVRGFGYRLG